VSQASSYGDIGSFEVLGHILENL